MSDRTPDDDDYHAWLLARERGEPGPPISDARASRYAQLGALIADLPAMPAGAVHRSGWEQEVLAAFDAEAGRPADHSATPPTAVADKPLPERPTRPRRRRWWAPTAAAAAFVMAASVVIVIFRHRDRGQEVPIVGGDDLRAGQPGQSDSANPPGQATRGMHVDQGRLSFDHAFQVRRAATAVPRELHDGDTVMTGDGLFASVVTSADAYVYIAHCADQHLQLFPSQRGVRTRAGDLVLIPDGGGQLELEGRPGSEVLYLIVSRGELSLADPQLAALVATAGDTTQAVDCGTSLDVRLMKSTATLPTSNVLRGARIPGTAVAADADGIAIVRYRFVHVAAEHVDDHMKPTGDVAPER